MINTVIALLVEKNLMTKEEGESLAKKLRDATLPSDFNLAHAQVKKFLKSIATDL
jgi:transcriptional regulator CtsR